MKRRHGDGHAVPASSVLALGPQQPRQAVALLLRAATRKEPVQVAVAALRELAADLG